MSSAASGPGVIEVAAGLLFHEGKLLITQRRPDDHLGGFWEFPGGKREARESFEECLVRELREELAIEVLVGELWQTVSHNYPEKSLLLNFYLCGLLGGVPRAIGCHELAWVTRKTLRDYEFPAADVQLIERLESADELWRWET